MNPISTRSVRKCFLWSCIAACCAFSVNAAEIVLTEPPAAELHCVVMPSAVVDVASGVSGRVETIEVGRGDTVRAGQRVAALESGVEQANLVLAKTRAELETGIHLRRARLAFEERKVKRTDKLHTRKVVSEHEQDEAETDARLAAWQLRQAVDDQYLARLELARAEEVLKRRSVESPIDGVVVERFKWPGEYVEEEPILRVARLDPLWIEVVAPVALHGEVQKNMLAEVMAETEGGKPREARVIVVDPMGDAASGTFRVRLELPNPDHSLLGGVKCKARFPAPARYAPATPDEKVAVAEPAATQPAFVPEPPPPEPAVLQVAPQEPVHVRQNAQKEVPNGFIVLTPPALRDERRELTRALRDAGVNDLLVMGRGPYSGRISLGTYDSRHMAERRRSDLSRLGFEADVVLRTSTISRVQADSGPSVVEEQSGGDKQQRREAALRAGDCPMTGPERLINCVGHQTVTSRDISG